MNYGFSPHSFYDISDTQEQKRKVVYCVVSPEPPTFIVAAMPQWKNFMEENWVEAFVRMNGRGQGGMMGWQAQNFVTFNNQCQLNGINK